MALLKKFVFRTAPASRALSAPEISRALSAPEIIRRRISFAIYRMKQIIAPAGWRGRMVLTAALLTLSQFATALDLYQGEAPVVDQSAEARSKALGQALLEVAIKVSGNANASSNGTVLSAASTPDRYMQRYEYRQELVRENGVPAVKLYLKGTFYAASMQQLLQRAGYAVWGSNKPSLSVYLFEQGQPLSTEMMRAMQDRAGSRGINIRFPGGVAASELVDFDALVARLTSSGQTILLGEVGARFALTDGQSTDTLSPDLDGLSDRLVQLLAKRISAANNAPPETVVVEIAGITAPGRYADALKAVFAINGVKSIKLLGARQNRLIVELSVKGGARKLVQEANNGSKFSADLIEATAESASTVPSPAAASTLLTMK